MFLHLRLSRKARRLFHFRGSPGTFPVEAALGDGAQLPGSNRRKPMAKEPKKLDELFHDTLKDIYFAEKKILATLPKMEKAAQATELKNAFAKHRGETEGHVARLEQVFAAIDKKPQGK